MLNYVWCGALISCIVFFCCGGSSADFSAVLFSSIEKSTALTVTIGGIMCFWSGIMHIADDAGLCTFLSRILRPFTKVLFPELKENSKALRFITMNIAANLLGMGNAATPLGISAMSELDKENPAPQSASDSMCMFVILNCASLQILPSTVIGLRASLGASSPGDIIPAVWLTSGCALAVSVALALIFKRYCKNV